VDEQGNLFFADFGNNVIRRVDKVSGIISTVAGTGTPGTAGDGGPATEAQLGSPSDIVLDTLGDLIITDFDNFCVRKLSVSTGNLTTVAGTCGTSGFAGDGGAATSALLASPKGTAVDVNGNLYIGDTSNNRVRFVSALTGVITTLAGTGTAGYGGDGASSTAALLSSPAQVRLDTDGNLYIADQGNSVIRKIAAGSGVISTVAGTGAAGFTGDGGPANVATINNAKGITVDRFGTLYVADQGNNAVRKIGPEGTISFSAQSFGTTSAAQTVVIENAGNAPLTFSSAPVVAGDFQISTGNTCGVSDLAAGATCALSVSFAPTGQGTRTGTVTFTDNGTSTTQTLNLSGLGSQAGTAITLTSSANPSVYNNPVVFAATVPTMATGTVVFKDGSTVLGNGTITGGTASFTTSSLQAGSHSITATYAGDSNYTGSTSLILTQTVSKADPVITWATPSPIIFGTALSSTQLNATSGGVVGTFAYTPDIGAVLPTGTQTLNVVFTPTDLVDYTTQSASTSILVNTALATVTVATSRNPIVYGDSVTFTFTFTGLGSGPIPTGSATVTDGTATLGTITINAAGVATYTTSDFVVGSHALKAVYLGDAFYH